MKIRSSSLFTIVLLGIIVFNLTGNVYTVKAYTLANSATFVADVTIPDGTYIDPGATFYKTWRLKNTGTAAWSTSYSLVFYGGEQMGGQSPIYLPKWVSPGQNIDLTVKLTAPTAGGTYRGYWKLQTGSGTQFGIGSAAANAFWVEIRVLGPTTSAVAYDFIQNMCGALWVYDGGPIPCPVNYNKTQYGYVVKLDNPTLENGAAAGEPALLTVPQNKYNGAIHGIFPIGTILKGDHFLATIGCQYGAYNCSVVYQLDYQTGSTVVTLWKFKEQYDGLYYQVDLDLSSLQYKKDVKLWLSVYANGYTTDDLPLWVNPRIVRNVQSPIVTPTPTFTPAPTATPGPTATPNPSACTNRAQFVADVTVPDGTTFAPNTSFTKVWRLKNVGTCTWDTSYDLTFVSGASMGGADTPLPKSVAPGQTVDAGVNLTSPSTAGSYRGYWELKSGLGSLFGIGSTYDKPFWVDITVSGTAPATTPTPTATATATTGAPGATATATPFSSGWFLFTNAKYGFVFQLPPGSTVASQTDNSSRIYLPILTSGTNLQEKYLDVSVVEGATTCQSPYTTSGTASQNVTINGIQFLQQSNTESAMSNIYDWTAYSTVKGTACISLTFVLHSTNPGVYATPPVVFDKAAESAVFTTIMSTYGNQ